MKSFLISNLKKTNFYKKIKRRLLKGYVSSDIILRGILDDNTWLLSTPKSGTNYVCSILSFYNAELLNIKDYSFGDRYKYGVVHENRLNSDNISDIINFSSKSISPIVVRTHREIEGVKPKYLICLTRNVFDNFISYYHFICN